MRRATFLGGVGMVAAMLVTVTAGADDAAVTVGDPRAISPDNGRFAHEPEPELGSPIVPDGSRTRPEVRPSPFRLQLGPGFATTGKGVGPGVVVAADMGSGTVGARLQAAWMRGEGHADDASYELGSGLGMYTAELTLDLHRRGPIHPLLGLGLGVVHVSRPGGEGSGTAGIGTGRLGLEYTLPVDDADVRLGVHASGVMTGPSDDEIKDLRAYALVTGVLSVGF